MQIRFDVRSGKRVVTLTKREMAILATARKIEQQLSVNLGSEEAERLIASAVDSLVEQEAEDAVV